MFSAINFLNYYHNVLDTICGLLKNNVLRSFCGISSNSALLSDRSINYTFLES
ncbi:unnamed protein product [Acanthoscelides obtectus]|uniref:Uncharacterized protein n=1 Tax=Acanthoscelides obtectus TaxID=200917 RepID=A0A9P0KIS5_ACAOB|nr:unnamed protein product [Acanthoscelides obtectus]CAK1664853.1 hypothetical protein AOBTE_LOCUS24508 [Acanthoscelides obtectus]